jgi:hypothetical protein
MLRNVNVKTLASANRPSARPATDHQLLIQAVAPARQTPIQTLSRRVADAGGHRVE